MIDNNIIQFPTISNREFASQNLQTVDARELHAFLNIGKVFAAWIKDRIQQYGFKENYDYFLTLSKIGKRQNVVAKEYALTLNMAKELSMVERNERGKEARQYFIECERHAKEAVCTNPLVLLQDPLTLQSLLLENVNKVVALEAKIQKDKQKTDFYDSFINQDGLYTLQNAARALQARPNLFIRWLKEKYLFYQGSALVPRVSYIQQGIFEVKTEIIDDKARARSFITPKGLQHLSKYLPTYVQIRGVA